MVSLDFGVIALAAGGVYSSKPRPVLIIQNPDFATGESVLVIPFTSQENPATTCRVAVSPSSENGLDRRCWLEIDKTSAIRTSWVGPTIGTLEPALLRRSIDLLHRLTSPAPDPNLPTIEPLGQ